MESEKDLRELVEPRELMEPREVMVPRVLMEPRYLMDRVLDVHVEYEVAYLEVYPTQVIGQRWYHLWDAMYEMVNAVTTVGYLMLWRLALSTPDKVQTCKSVGVWKVMCNVRVGKVMRQCECVWKVMCRCVGV